MTEYSVFSTIEAQIIDGIDHQGYVVIENAIPAELCLNFLQKFKSFNEDEFKLAGIGREAGFQTNQSIRSDYIHWLQGNELELSPYFQLMEQLRLHLNRHFYLGLYDYECMFAHYPEKAFYQKHVDAFKDKPKAGNNRIITTILYLNPDWPDDQGGELLLYQHDEEKPFKTVLPKMGTLVIFLSDEFPHEVLPAKKSRYSITGWFRTK